MSFFRRLKNRMWGQELFSMPVNANYKSSVYLWDKDGARSINIKSENFSYAQGPSRNDGTVSFALGEVEDLIKTLRLVADMNSKFPAGGLSS